MENFPREFRLLTSDNFNNVFQDPIKAGSKNVTVLAKANNLSFPRLGLIVPKKALKRAVWRNRIKRLVRENFRRSRNSIPAIDLIVIVRSGIKQMDNKSIDSQITRLWKTVSHRYNEQPAS